MLNKVLVGLQLKEELCFFYIKGFNLCLIDVSTCVCICAAVCFFWKCCMNFWFLMNCTMLYLVVFISSIGCWSWEPQAGWLSLQRTWLETQRVEALSGRLYIYIATYRVMGLYSRRDNNRYIWCWTGPQCFLFMRNLWGTTKVRKPA